MSAAVSQLAITTVELQEVNASNGEPQRHAADIAVGGQATRGVVAAAAAAAAADPKTVAAAAGGAPDGIHDSSLSSLSPSSATAADSMGRRTNAPAQHASEAASQLPEQHVSQIIGSKSNPKSKGNSNPRLAKLEDLENLDELFEGVYDNEEELVAKLMQQLQGLSHKQQRLYGIWDGSPDSGKRAFVEQWRRRHADRRAMVAALRDPTRPPTERMSLRTSYILKWRKVLFSCPHCWLLPGLCVCSRMQRFTPLRTHVVVHAHHGEWGSASNSGCILPNSLDGSEILLYSHPEHDARLREILSDASRTTALLWPGSDSLLPDQLSALAEERTRGRITVVALDATWGNARRMQGWFPKGTLTVRLPPESTLKENKLSLLRPVRRYRGDLESGRVSTVEAVASLLYELEGDETMYRGLLDNLKVKVDACRLQKNRTLVYDTHAPEQPSARHRWRQGGGANAGQKDLESHGEGSSSAGQEEGDGC